MEITKVSTSLTAWASWTPGRPSSKGSSQISGINRRPLRRAERKLARPDKPTLWNIILAQTLKGRKKQATL